ncbi:glucosamine kinase [Catenulispora sp. GAS73]|uniref:N-acetylglucosamine kinase n=1 Tax=Catenulispora sp. GAS73 TaxID=3156269 RepID=UPI003517E51F
MSVIGEAVRAMAGKTLVLGLDVGGTTSRALLATSDGQQRGAGRSAGGNPTVHNAVVAAAAVEAAVGEAMNGSDPEQLAAVTVGLAGGGKLTSVLEAGDAFGRMWERVGVDCQVSYVPDALVAFAAGTPAKDGSVLLAGTGSISAAVRRGRVTAHGDGHGWLLGDRGSGFWLARQAAVAALADLDGPGPVTALTQLVVESLFGTDSAPSALDVILAVTARTPSELADLAPLVTTACEAGDPVALRIAERAAELLLATLSSVRSPGESTAIVLSGSVLTQDTPVATGVLRGVAELWPEAPVSQATDGAAGAAWLAIERLPGGALPEARTRLFADSAKASKT